MSLVIDEKIHKSTTVFKILSDPTRFKILCLLVKRKKGLCVHELAEAVDISHSAVSHQLDKLEAHNIVIFFREGQVVCYELKRNTITKKYSSCDENI